jgi:hypothetical protein
MTIPSGKGWGTDVYRAVFLPIDSTGGIDVPGYPEPAEDGFGGYEFLGPKNLTLNLGSPRAITNVSQGRVNDTIYLPSTDAKTAEFHLSYIDQVLFSILGAVKRRTDIGEGSTMPFGTDKQGLEIAGAFLISNLAFHDENSNPVWHNYMLPKVRAIVTQPSMDENAVDVTVNLSLGSSTKHLWGQAVTEAIDGATRLTGYDHITEFRFNIHAWLADGSEDIFLFPADKPPISSAKTSVWNFTDGVEITSGFVVNTANLDFTLAPSANDLIVALYEYPDA